MVAVDDATFQELVNQALEALPGEHIRNISNVAILYEQEPTPLQRQKANLRPNQTLLGLYEGVPISQRQGMVRTLPDTITLFKLPLQQRAQTIPELREEIKHTLWHEIAHYYGLNHDQIHNLE